jgi:outer membrane biosynthesis protein TonB
MTSSSRRALPWLVSIGSHLAGLTVVGILLAHPTGLALAPRVDITFAGAPGTGRGALQSGRAAMAGVPLPTPAPARVSAGTADQAPRPSGQAADAIPLPGSTSADDAVPAPTAGDVLADVASMSPAATGSPSGAVVGWEGVQRRLIRYRNPEFPTVLSAIGQEVECEFRISISPSGIVTRVEITRSSGYIEIDASVEAALRDRLYSRVDGTLDKAETVHFRFRLEKQD